MKNMTKYAVMDIYGYFLTFSGERSTTTRASQATTSIESADLFDTQAQARRMADMACEKKAEIIPLVSLVG